MKTKYSLLQLPTMLLVHAIIEVFFGIVLIFRPQTLLLDSGGVLSTLLVSKLYGILAFSFGTMSFLLYQIFQYTSVFRKVIIIIMAFHIMIGFQMYGAYHQGATTSLGATVVHLTLASLILIVFMKELGKFHDEK